MNAAAWISALALAWGIAGNAAAQTAPAPSTHLVVHGLSHHTEPRKSGKEWNEVNTGLALRVRYSADWSAQAGIYKDSVFKPTGYLLTDWTMLHVQSVSLGGFAGGKYDGDLKPIVGGVLRYEQHGWSLTTRVAPAPQSRGWVVTAEAGVRF